MLILRNRQRLFLLALFLLSPLCVSSAPAESRGDEEKKEPSRRIWMPPPRTAIGTENRPAKMEWHRWKLSVLSRRLDRDLARFETASEWQSFLRLPDDFTSLVPQVKVSQDPEELQHLLKRFTVVTADNQYQSVATMPSFLAVYDALETYVALLEEVAPPGRKIPLSPEISPPNEPADPEPRWVQAGPIQRLPPVLTPGADPQLLTPPLKDRTIR